ncbi:flagellar hook-associated protein FlgK [Microbacterium sp.]|uniref:flagellar hook-associated protein FlgK n=1 Tax=Microbacterium sp. TaxID=51671 RepID=UPI003A8E2429
MSTFSGLNTAASGLAAARRGMDVVGQNIANQNTVGYTRQRLTTSAVGAPAQTGHFVPATVPGQGVSIDGIARLGDALRDARVRDTLAASGFWSTRALAATTAETAMAEPTADGLAARLSAFWAGWQDLANTPDSPAAGAVVLGSAQELAGRLAEGYRAVAAQWADARRGVDGAVAQVNTAADQIAALNRQIRDAAASGVQANELIDQRGVLAQTLARTVGARAVVEPDGTMTVRVDGNALVSGTNARRLEATGPASLDSGQDVSLRWADSGLVATLVDGELGGTLAVLAPAGAGGTLAQVAASYSEVATALADRVNAQHRAGVTASGEPGGDFFAVSPSGPAALGLSVVATSFANLALAAPGSGAIDASNADALSQLGTATGSPDEIWADRILRFGVATAADVQRARLAESTAVTAASAQQSVAGVDGDEETVSLVAYQASYQAAARMISAIDEALDVLINRTGIVGR